MPARWAAAEARRSLHPPTWPRLSGGAGLGQAGPCQPATPHFTHLAAPATSRCLPFDTCPPPPHPVPTPTPHLFHPFTNPATHRPTTHLPPPHPRTHSSAPFFSWGQLCPPALAHPGEFAPCIRSPKSDLWAGPWAHHGRPLRPAHGLSHWPNSPEQTANE